MWIPSVEVIDSLVKKQEWNQREIQVLATHAAVESRFDLLESGRRDAHQQMSGHDDPNAETDPDDEVTEPDLPGNIT